MPGAVIFPFAWTVYICKRHDTLPGNATFRDNLLNIVLYGVKQAGNGRLGSRAPADRMRR
jgi:hypothetical protein